MEPVIFLEKVRRPDQRGLVRERLDRRTLALRTPGEDPVSIGLVLGPPGSGKTTLLSHLAAASDGASAWYRVGTEDDGEVALTRHLAHTLGAALGAPDLIQTGATGSITDLVRALDEGPPRTAQLIVDDLHEIAGTPAERALETFVTLRPRGIKVILGSRRPLAINTSRLLVSGELVQLDGEDLRFRTWEVEQLFRTVYAAPLSPEAAAALTLRTGGWAAGLQLFQLATAAMGRVERERAIDGLSGRSRLIRSYLARNVLDGLDAERRRFLLLTSTLGVLTGDLCDDLLDSAGSAAILSELEQAQFFTTSTDGGLTYHYHQVLQTHLEVVLVDELGGRTARELYRRSGQLLEAAGRIGAAIRAHARAEDWGAVARLLRPGSAVAGDDAVWGTLTLPGGPVDDPGLVLAGARRSARNGRLVDAVNAFRRAEELLDDPDFRRRCAAERQAVALWLPKAPLPTVPPGSAHDGLLPLSVAVRQLSRQLPVSGRAYGSLAQGIGLLMAGDGPAAGRALTAAETETGPCWQPIVIRLARRWLDLITAPGEFSAGQVEEIMLDADVAGWPWLSRIARGLQLGMLLAVSPDDWRISSAVELLDDLERRGDRWTLGLNALSIAAGLMRSGRSEQASALFARAAHTADELGAPALRTWATVLEGSLEPIDVPTAQPEAVAVAAMTIESIGDARPGVQLSCLGGFSLLVGGAEVPWRTLRPRVRSLLMLLAVRHGRPVHREQLVDALWPDASLASGIRSLQVAVSAIRHCLTVGGLTDDALPRRGDTYALELPPGCSQLAEFERLVQAAGRATGLAALQLRLAALDHYTGDLLPEVGPAEWVLDERDRLRLLAASVASAAARDALAVGDPRTALETARRSVSLDPYHDSAWELIIDLNARLGDHSAAAVARREQARIWADLGLVRS